ncbi:MAG: 3'-5' exonuclease [Bacteroidia bacterium]|nr:3'-5' exonuclease [Bacteroidia bacterium]
MHHFPEASADTAVIFDFETSGLSPNYGDRAIEIGAVRIKAGVVVDRFQQLMNPGFRISGFIESYTGISNDLLRDAPACEEVMEAFADFIGDDNLVAHNASFDKRFLEAELERVGIHFKGNIACSMLLARRIYQRAPNHKLGTLVAYRNIQAEDVFHRALADSEMTSRLWLKMIEDLQSQYLLPPLSFATMQKLSRTPKSKVHSFLSGFSSQ